MIWNSAAREERQYVIGSPDQRHQFERDRDRLLYSSPFHRLAGVTQIVRAGEAEYFHTRQQHTIKVAQVGRRLAQHCIREQHEICRTWGIDAEVVEAACLAHDLGHPPFGHIGEDALNELCVKYGLAEGFEGNAQSFRIITKIGVRYDEVPGLNLTRATLAAVLKYPWLKDPNCSKKSKKWSAYESEREEFAFARSFHPHDEQTAEAALMDWADDIAYSIHDLEDFHRAGVIPWRKVFSDEAGEGLVERTAEKWFGAPSDAIERLRFAHSSLRDYFYAWNIITDEIYDGSKDHRIALRALTSSLIGRYVQATKLTGRFSGYPVEKSPEEEAEVLLLKRIAREYIISNPNLLAQQHGQKKIIEGLFESIMGHQGDGVPPFLPHRLHYLWELSDGHRARFAADCIAGLTESQATALYGRLFGTAAGSVLDPLIR